MRAFLAAVVVALVVSAMSRADLLPPGTKNIPVEHKIESEKEYPDWVFFIVRGSGGVKKVTLSPKSAIVIPGCRIQRIEVEDIDLAAGNCHIPVGGEPADLVVQVWRRHCVIQINEVIGRKTGVERDPEQAALDARIDIERHKRLGLKHAVVDDADFTSLLQHEQTAVGGEIHRRGVENHARLPAQAILRRR